MNMQTILVVCVGNICRSPMAEYFLKNNHPNLNIESAGLSAMYGHSADGKAIDCMAQLDIDMRPHIDRQINAEMIKNTD
mgnify:CR=1 FL=1